jgi:predicted RecA/RadA family phage recombinase
MKNFVQPGDVLTFHAPTGGLSSGDGVLVGGLFGVAAYDAAEGAEVEVQLKGVFRLPKATGAVAEGQALYWDATAKVLTTTASGNTLAAHAAEAAASGAADIAARLYT